MMIDELRPLDDDEDDKGGAERQLSVAFGVGLRLYDPFAG